MEEIKSIKKIKIPSIGEIAEKEGIYWEEAAEKCIIICGTIHLQENIDCFRKLYGHGICKGCPRYFPKKPFQLNFFLGVFCAIF
jgi:hypothetical protein